MTQTITLSREGALTIADIEAVAVGGAKVALAADAREQVAAFRAAAERALTAALASDPDKRVYGLNTGFGSNFKEYVSPDERFDVFD